MGEALMGTGMAAGDDRAVEAAQSAISSPLLEGVSITGSQGVLINIAASSNLTMMEIDEAVDIVYKSVGQEANIIFGVVIDESLEENMMVTVIATGFNKKAAAKKAPEAKTSTMPFRAVGFDLGSREEESKVEEKAPEEKPAPPKIEKEEYVANNPGTYKKYDVPAYERRNVSHEVLRGGFDIPKQNQAENNEGNQEEQEEERPRSERAAFLRRIMD